MDISVASDKYSEVGNCGAHSMGVHRQIDMLSSLTECYASGRSWMRASS